MSSGSKVVVAVAVVTLLAVIPGCRAGSPTGAGTAPTTTGPPPAATATGRCGSDGQAMTDVVYRTVPGIDPKQLSLDVYPVATRDRCSPVVLWIHGGGFTRGDKGNDIDRKRTLFNDAGWTLVSINYRLTTPGTVGPTYPGPQEDAVAAVRWVKDNIAAQGGDPSRIAVLGHSAGASIVAGLSTDEQLLASAGLAIGDIACAGPFDTEQFDLTAMSRLSDGEDGNLTPVFGTDPARLAAVSPINNIEAGKGIPPMILARRGSIGRQNILADFTTKLSVIGVPTTVIDASKLSHPGVNRAIGTPGDTIMTPPLMALLRSCFNTSRPTP